MVSIKWAQIKRFGHMVTKLWLTQDYWSKKWKKWTKLAERWPSRAHEMCIWLYFGHWFSELHTCFKMLQEAKRLKDKLCIEEYQNCAMTKCSKYGYLWNAYYYVFGEANILKQCVNESQWAPEFNIVDNYKHDVSIGHQHLPRKKHLNLVFWTFHFSHNVCSYLMFLK